MIVSDWLATGLTRASMRADRWYVMLVLTRVIGLTVALILLAAHAVTPYDDALAIATVLLSALTLVAFGRSQRLRGAPLAWALDLSSALTLVLLSGDWRSPFYVYGLTTLILPATALPWRAALTWGISYSLLYGIVAVLTRRLPAEVLESSIRLETIATHIAVPTIITLLLAHASGLLDELREARAEASRLELETERRRIAWDLHDSAKQRVHAAHLMLTALSNAQASARTLLIDSALAELRGAVADMETSVAELREPLDGRPVDELLRQRARELDITGEATITINGTLPKMSALRSAHAFRIASEALTNAIRHAQGNRIDISLSSNDLGAQIVVCDDGVGMPTELRPGSNGLRSMQGRAETIGAQLEIGPNPAGNGTRACLTIPHQGDSYDPPANRRRSPRHARRAEGRT